MTSLVRTEYEDCVFKRYADSCYALSAKYCKDGSVCHFYKSDKEWKRDEMGFVERRKK